MQGRVRGRRNSGGEKERKRERERQGEKLVSYLRAYMNESPFSFVQVWKFLESRCTPHTTWRSPVPAVFAHMITCVSTCGHTCVREESYEFW
mmetsp:Transcript_3646/g.5205  ORF Transcript_3646/g.5205 Transcript_3646/m.5205 type:complete len:92 (+) Transcript_3646:164-439(+)